MDVFYQRLFEQAPATQRLFGQADMVRQKKALLGTLVVLRNSLRDLGPIVPTLQSLGARHAGYGVQATDYPLVGAALLGAMAEIGGTNWKPEYTAAWTDAYQVVQGAMLAGAPTTRSL